MMEFISMLGAGLVGLGVGMLIILGIAKLRGLL